MEKYKLRIQCGRSSPEDPKKVSIPGELIVYPGSKKLLLCVTGFIGDFRDYLPYFAEKLGEDFNIYLTELRRKGWANIDNCSRDLTEIDKRIRELLGIDEVTYIGHSAGMNAIAQSRKFNFLKIKGFYGICAYPSLGDTRTRNIDLEKRGLKQRTVDLLGKLNFGPFGSELKECQFEEPVRFAIAGNDELLRTYDPKILERFRKYFRRNPKESEIVFDEMNHCFNYTPWNLKPFNRDKPVLLIEDIKNFVDSI